MLKNTLAGREVAVAADKKLVEVVETVYDNGNGRSAFVCLIRDPKTGKLSTIDADKLVVNDKPTANLG